MYVYVCIYIYHHFPEVNRNPIPVTTVGTHFAPQRQQKFSYASCFPIFESSNGDNYDSVERVQQENETHSDRVRKGLGLIAVLLIDRTLFRPRSLLVCGRKRRGDHLSVSKETI